MIEGKAGGGRVPGLEIPSQARKGKKSFCSRRGAQRGT